MTSWAREFLASLKARDLSGVHLVISNAHAGLKAAVAQQFTGPAWQRCRVHFMRNVHGAVSTKQPPVVTAAVNTIFAHIEPAEVAAQWDQLADTLESSFPKVTAMMAEAKPDVLAFTASPKAHWQKIWSNNQIERLNKEIKRRADVVEIFPNPAAFLRLATAVVIEGHDEWRVTRRYRSAALGGSLIQLTTTDFVRSESAVFSHPIFHSDGFGAQMTSLSSRRKQLNRLNFNEESDFCLNFRRSQQQLSDLSRNFHSFDADQRFEDLARVPFPLVVSPSASKTARR